MEYKELSNYLERKMSMSHIYQPVMIMTLLQNGGECNQRDIAKAILSYDVTQIDYYTNITNGMVGKVLRRNGVVTRDNSSKNYLLDDFESLTDEQVNELIELCRQKLEEYLERYGDRIFQHRSKSAGYISGTIKYEVHKRAKFRCELCGISADEKALEVDHIIPRNKGGSDDISNFQALCYSCNARKRDTDDTDFRGIADSYNHRDKGCVFCEIDKDRILAENELAYIIRDGFPVTGLHSLIIPKRHIASYFDLGQAEVNACNQLMKQAKAEIESTDKTITGFNIGVNSGESAGQTIFHCHIHQIPRRDKDVDNPRGGIRHVIPSKGNYSLNT